MKLTALGAVVMGLMLVSTSVQAGGPDPETLQKMIIKTKLELSQYEATFARTQQYVGPGLDYTHRADRELISEINELARIIRTYKTRLQILETGALEGSFADQYRQVIGEVSGGTDRHSKVKTSLNSFLGMIQKYGEHRRYSVNQISGFSGAGYKDKTRLLKNVNEIVESIKERGGYDDLHFVVLGGSVDGIGAAYGELSKYRNVVSAGMVADHVVQYEIDGIRNDWGASIAQQDYVYLVPNTMDAEGKRWWELKSSPAARSETTLLLERSLKDPNCDNVRQYVVEGGNIALKEQLEMLIVLRRMQLAQVNKMDLVLMIGDEAGKPAKDQGPRAASQLALILNKYPELQSPHLRITVIDVNADIKFGSVQQFFASQNGKALLRRAGSTKDLMVTAQKAVADATAASDKAATDIAQAQVKQLKSLDETFSVFESELKLAQARGNSTNVSALLAKVSADNIMAAKCEDLVK